VDGKPRGKITMPTVSKPDAEWKHNLSTISYNVTRHDGRSGPTLATRGIFTIRDYFAASAAIRLLRYGTFQFRNKVRIRDRLVELLAGARERERFGKTGHNVRDGADGGFPPAMRGSPRTLLRRWTAPDWTSLLHELCGDAI
jgi:hypothetical protein